MTPVHLFKSPAFSPIALVGWALILAGGGWDLVYHLAPLLAAVHWSRAIDLLGEFGHTVVFAGMVIVVFGILWQRARHPR